MTIKLNSEKSQLKKKITLSFIVEVLQIIFNSRSYYSIFCSNLTFIELKIFKIRIKKVSYQQLSSEKGLFREMAMNIYLI